MSSPALKSVPTFTLLLLTTHIQPYSHAHSLAPYHAYQLSSQQCNSHIFSGSTADSHPPTAPRKHFLCHGLEQSCFFLVSLHVSPSVLILLDSDFDWFPGCSKTNRAVFFALLLRQTHRGGERETAGREEERGVNLKLDIHWSESSGVQRHHEWLTSWKVIWEMRSGVKASSSSPTCQQTTQLIGPFHEFNWH